MFFFCWNAPSSDNRSNSGFCASKVYPRYLSTSLYDRNLFFEFGPIKYLSEVPAVVPVVLKTSFTIHPSGNCLAMPREEPLFPRLAFLFDRFLLSSARDAFSALFFAQLDSLSSFLNFFSLYSFFFFFSASTCFNSFSLFLIFSLDNCNIFFVTILSLLFFLAAASVICFAAHRNKLLHLLSISPVVPVLERKKRKREKGKRKKGKKKKPRGGKKK